MSTSTEPELADLSEYADIEYEELVDGLEKKLFTLIDVRNPDEIATQGAIPGAINMPLPEVPDGFRNLTDEEFKSKFGFEKRDPNLVFSCKSGRRAEAAIENLRGTVPIAAFKLYKGSFSDWVARGGTVIKKE